MTAQYEQAAAQYEQAAIDKLRERSKAFRMTFTPGTPAHEAFVDLGRYCHVYQENVATGDQALILVGLRRAFFHIWNHLNLDDQQLAAVYGAARRQGD